MILSGTSNSGHSLSFALSKGRRSPMSPAIQGRLGRESKSAAARDDPRVPRRASPKAGQASSIVRRRDQGRPPPRSGPTRRSDFIPEPSIHEELAFEIVGRLRSARPSVQSDPVHPVEREGPGSSRGHHSPLVLLVTPEAELQGIRREWETIGHSFPRRGSAAAAGIRDDVHPRPTACA